MNKTTRWWWIRHAPVNSGGIIYGDNDVDCDCSNPVLFREVADRLPREALWVTNHLRRTRQTAEAFAAHAGLELADPLVEPRLAEQGFGDWQGLSHDELRTREEFDWHRFWIAPARTRPPGGESFADLMERVRQAMSDLLQQNAGRDIVCVAHGGTIRAALGVALGLEPERALRFAVDNCSLTRMDHFSDTSEPPHDVSAEDSWRVSLVNFPPQS